MSCVVDVGLLYHDVGMFFIGSLTSGALRLQANRGWVHRVLV